MRPNMIELRDPQPSQLIKFLEERGATVTGNQVDVSNLGPGIARLLERQAVADEDPALRLAEAERAYQELTGTSGRTSATERVAKRKLDPRAYQATVEPGKVVGTSGQSQRVDFQV